MLCFQHEAIILTAGAATDCAIMPIAVPTQGVIAPVLFRIRSRVTLWVNAMAENFFSILKCECIYRRKPQTGAQAKKIIDEFIWFYNKV